ncbi:hypothetical protein ZTR_10653 [Talaromyces verruculosus]|nr:hypothetical protein ZTR_10653 [Talaromyces verruculosus]
MHTTVIATGACKRKHERGVKAEDWDGFHDLIVIDEIARCGYLGVIWALTSGNSIRAPPFINFGTPEQKTRLLPSILDGIIGFCLGVTEPDVRTRHGEKKGVSALIIPLKAKGVTRRKIENSEVRASGSTYLKFDDVEVPVSNLLGPENGGFEILMSNFNHERLWLACTSLRMARCCAENVYKYDIIRETFGNKLIANQVIRMKISSFGRSIDSAHAWMEQIFESAKKKASDAYVGGLISNLTVLSARTLEHVSRESQQVLGGAGYSMTGRGARIEQISRDVTVMVVGGNEEILVDLTVNQEVKALEKIQQRMEKL